MKSSSALLAMLAALFAMVPGQGFAQAILKLGDVLIAEPGTASVRVVDPVTGTSTLLATGGLLAPVNKAIGVALAADGDVIVVHRQNGLIRVNPVSGAQSVLSSGGMFRDPWAIAIDQNTGYVYVADSGYDNDRPSINEAGKIIRVDPVTGQQVLIAAGSPCTIFPSGAACQNTTSAGSYLTHPYGLDIDYTLQPGTLIVADMSSFNGKGAIIRIQPVPNGAQTLLWGPASAVPAPVVPQSTPLGCPMGVAVEPTGNILATTFTFPVPPSPTVPPPTGTFYGCAPPGVFRIDLLTGVQTVVNTNAPDWQANHAYAAGAVVRDNQNPSRVHRAVTAGVSQGTTPNWNSTPGGTTADGTVSWTNIGRGGDWLIPFGMDTEAAPTPQDPDRYNIIVGDEGHSALFRMDANGGPLEPTPFATGLMFVTSVDVINSEPIGGFKREPIRSNGQPAGVLPPTTAQVTMSLQTDVNATCKYSSVAGVTYGAMPNTFTTTGSTSHSSTVTGLTPNGTYNFYVRCLDTLGNANTTDYAITFSVAGLPSLDPVAAFGFNEGSGLVLNDFSGLGNHGTVSGAAWTASGRFGGALSFDGVNDWVTVPDSSSLDLTTGMTIEAWVFPTALGNGIWRNVLIKERPGGEVWNIYANEDTNAPVVFIADPSGTPQDARGSSQLPLNTWTHLAATYDANALRLYVNGTQVGQRALSGTLLNSSMPLRIGGNSIWGEFFQGRIDEVRIYNRALTPAEIATDMATAVSDNPPADTVPPVRSNGQPTLTLPFGTTSTTLSLTTNEDATCRYNPVAGVAYGAMTGTFTTTGGMVHSTQLNGLTNGTNYTYSVRCIDGSSNVNTDDYLITFAVSSSATVSTSSFIGTQNPLSENGMWDSPGSWADLQKDNGAFATGANAMGRVVAPAVSAGQYSEIVYDQDPGDSSWVGVATRIQGPNNGSGYLAIAFAGEVRLYRADDTGSLNFTLLAVSNAAIGVAPRRLRLESDGNTHRVSFNGVQLINHTATGTTYASGQPGIAASVFGGPQVKILGFEGGSLPTAAPFRFDGQPTGAQPTGTTQVTLSLSTDENATCRYSTTPGVAYASMTGAFTTTGALAHSTTVSGLANGGSYSYFVRCIDTTSNANTDDYEISFSVTGTGAASSTFPGIESPLSQGGLWDSPGSWADLQTNDGAFATGLNALGRRVTPQALADQYAEIVYNQDPGDASWVGVSTRIQSGGDGSGYLAIAYAGEVRLYRTDDFGSLNFTLLASAAADLGAAPRRLRLESEGDTHRVYFNGALLINHTATGIIYATGQPGIAASVFGGPLVKILSYEGGSLDPPALAVNDVSFTEGNAGSLNASVTVSLTRASAQTVTVQYGTANGTATSPQDYTPASGTVTFTPGTTTPQTIVVPVIGDLLDEDDETVLVNLFGAANATIAKAQGVLTITDNDAAPSLSINSPTVTEGNSGTTSAGFTVTLSAVSGRTVTVNYATANVTATAPADYTAASSSLTFTPGTTSLQVPVSVVGDLADEVNETFTVILSGASNATITTATGTATITDDDPAPTISIADASQNEGNAGNSPITFTVSLSTASGRTVTVNYATANGSATAGTTGSADYVGATGTLTFNPGTTTQTIAVQMRGDATIESNETFVVNLSVPTNATIADTQATGTIVNDDLPVLSINNVTVTEGTGGSVNATFTVTLTPSVSQVVTVNYATANNTATVGSDFTNTTGSLSFSAGATTRTFTVPVLGDSLDEDSETYFVNLSGAVNATIGTAQGTGTITDNDASPSLAINSPTVNEGNSGTVNAGFTVTLSAVSGRTVTVNYATANGSATAPGDYTAASGSLTFAPGTTSLPVPVVVAGDLLDEPTESFTVTLSGASNASIATATGTASISDDDPTPTLTFSDLSQNEGNSGNSTMNFVVTLSAVSGRTVTVNYNTANGSATAGTTGSADYVAASGTLTFNPGTTTQTIAVTLRGDTTVESNETFVLNLTGASNATIPDSQVTATIVNDDLPSLSINSVSVNEGNSGSVTATFTVTLSPSTSQTVTVNYATANNTAVAGSDYSSVSGTLSFSSGATTRTFTVSVLGDTLDEENETFFVNLSGASANATIGTAQGVGTITDNDNAPEINIGNVSATEGDSGTKIFNFPVTLTAASGRTITVNYSTSNLTATAGTTGNADYVAASGTLTFTPGTTTLNIPVTVRGDNNNESNEIFLVNLSSATNASIDDGLATGTIQDDD